MRKALKSSFRKKYSIWFNRIYYT